MKKDDVLFVCTLVTVASAVVGTTCAVLMAYNMHKAVGEIRRVADNVTKKVAEVKTRRNSVWEP